MREMKVRVWDDVLKEMLYSRVEEFDDMLGFRFEKHLETENPIYMWSTSLKDKNGKEIYEGDIVKGRYWINGIPHRIIGQIKYAPTKFYISGVRKYESTNVEPDRSFEVIGNIYENPELLKGEETA